MTREDSTDGELSISSLSWSYETSTISCEAERVVIGGFWLEQAIVQ